MAPLRSVFSAILLLALRHAAATADLPILHGGEAPQIGVVRIYGEPGTLLVTGKNWPSLWHIRLKEVRR
jgi:hypothetical protein